MLDGLGFRAAGPSPKLSEVPKAGAGCAGGSADHVSLRRTAVDVLQSAEGSRSI